MGLDNYTIYENSAFNLLSRIEGVSKIKITKDTYYDYDDPTIVTTIKSIIVTYSLNGNPLEFKLKLGPEPNGLDFSTTFFSSQRRLLKEAFKTKFDNLEGFGTPENKKNILRQALVPNNDS